MNVGGVEPSGRRHASHFRSSGSSSQPPPASARPAPRPVTGLRLIGWIQSNEGSAAIGNKALTGVSVRPSRVRLDASRYVSPSELTNIGSLIGNPPWTNVRYGTVSPLTLNGPGTTLIHGRS